MTRLLPLKRALKARFVGVSWQSPSFRVVLPVLDAADFAVRFATGRRELPRYAFRVRSNGIDGQFGGSRFVALGGSVARLLRDAADLKRDSDALEVGCGCGRVAIALADFLAPGRYTGIDVDRVSVKAFACNPVLARARFRVLHVNVENEVYNPGGKARSTEFAFPFPDASFDVVFAISVFTHMLSEEVDHYVEEIARVLRPGGRFLVSALLTDFGTGKGEMTFPSQRGPARLHQERNPRKVVAYPSSFLDGAFESRGVVRHRRALTGTWRRDPHVVPDVDFGQDVLVYEKRESAPPSSDTAGP